jgi:acetoin utilization deacetylase AcuC-like enzyme
MSGMPPRAVIVHSERYECDIGRHVFPVEKYRRIRDRLVADGDIAAADLVAPVWPERADLALVHTLAYLDDLDALRWTPRTMYSELPLTAEIVNAYVLAAGGTLLAAKRALDGSVAVHLGGGFHHAFADRAEGFCYINDLAVAIRVVQRDGIVQRAAVVDLDVHQGNGTAHVFRDDPAVMTVSMHQERNYPAFKERSDIDIGLEDGTGDTLYLQRLAEALESVWTFAPQLVLFQAGADPYVHDQLGGLALSLAGLERRDALVLEGCARRGIPCVVTLGGGYAVDVEDTVGIHANTCRVALRVTRAGDSAR